MPKLFSTLVLILLTAQFWSVQAQRHTDFGLEVQQYPTGFLFGICAERNIGAHHSLHVRIGYNSLDHKDFGEHDSEVGGGLGTSLGYNYYFKTGHRGLFLGARSDLWFNEVDWYDDIGGNRLTGTTEVVVLQPTASIGYLFFLTENLILTPKLSGGVELNIKTEGAEVGQGAILLWGLNLALRLDGKEKSN